MSIEKHGRDLTAVEVRDMVGESPFIIEIGSNDGFHTAQFIEAMPNAHICCFEFHPGAVEDFQAKRLEVNGRINLHSVPISHRFEMRTPDLSGGIPDCRSPKKPWQQSSTIVGPKEHLQRSPEIIYSKGKQVQCYPLDYFWDEYQLPVDFIWCDVEGSENLVILGGQKTLPQTRYAIFEFYERELYHRGANLRTLISMLPDFDLIAIYGDNALFKNRSL